MTNWLPLALAVPATPESVLFGCAQQRSGGCLQVAGHDPLGWWLRLHPPAAQQMQPAQRAAAGCSLS